MPVIFEQGNRFWIERLSPNVVIADTAGDYDSALVPLTKAGDALAVMVTARNPDGVQNANQAVGMVTPLTEASAVLGFGTFITGIILRLNKQASTSGAQTLRFTVVVFMRGRGSN